MVNLGSVLLIEDNPADRRLVTEYLSETLGQGCELRHAATLAAGLEALRQRPADLVLLDLALPDSAGLATYVEVRAQAPRTPVIILTSDDDQDQAVAALRVGAEDYLAKSQANSAGLIRAMRHAVTRRLVADKLRDSQARYRSIVETAEEGILQLDSQGTILFANARAALMLKAGAPGLVGRSFLALVDAADGPAAAALLATTPGQRGSCELQLPARDGTTAWALAAAGSVALQHGERIEVVLMLTDIGARKLAEQELVALKSALESRVTERTAQLQAANAELEAFNHSVVHDLHTPLSGVIGLAALLHADLAPLLPAAQLHRLQLIQRSAGRMKELIRGLLSLANLARREMAAEAVDLSAMVADVAAQLEAAQPQRRVVWSIEPRVHALGDRSLLLIVVQNLLDNAWKYSQGSDPARIAFGIAALSGPSAASSAASPAAAPTAAPAAAPEAASAAAPVIPSAAPRSALTSSVYFVRDNGIGFDMTRATRLFTPFQRLPSAGGFAGTGIGLANARSAIERHGGEIWFDSQPGAGSTFFFTLRAAGALH